MEEKLISIIMPTYNRGYIIDKAIKSVMQQSYSNWELIIVDDGSNDDTREKIEAYRDERIRILFNKTNCGANYSRNRGCAIAQGEYFAFLDSDNYWSANKLERQVQLLDRADDNVALVFCREEVRNETIYFLPDSQFNIKDVEKTIVDKNFIDTSTVLMRQKVFVEVGGFDNNIPRLQDWELFFRIIKIHKYDVLYDDEVLNINIWQKNSISNSNKRYVDAMIYMLKKHENIFRAEKNFWDYFFIIRNQTNSEEERRYFEHKFVETFADRLDNCKEMLGVLIEKFSKEQKYYQLLLNWKINEGEKGTNFLLSSFVKTNETIAIYGLGTWGELIYQELKNAGISVSFGIDKNVEYFHGLEIIRPQEKLQGIDIIIVSIFQEFQEIKRTLEINYQGRIVSIEELIMSDLLE